MSGGGRRPIPPADIVTFPRDVFLHDVWDYAEGDMVTILAPYGGGKTQLGYQLLEVTATEKLPVMVMVMKPRDETVTKLTARLKLLVMRDWPPSRLRFWQKKPRGYVLWPTHSFDPDVDDARHGSLFKRAILWCYKKGHWIVFADETYSLEHELGLTKILRTVWTKGRSMKCGLWAASQRPAYISLWAYQAHHIFIGHDSDVAAQKRYGEIGGGIDPDIVRQTVMQLGLFQFLYINRNDRTMCIVDR